MLASTCSCFSALAAAAVLLLAFSARTVRAGAPGVGETWPQFELRIQPVVTEVEAFGSHANGAMTAAAPNPWCGNRKMYWVTGNDAWHPQGEKPMCQNVNGTWSNGADGLTSYYPGWDNIYRKECTLMDVNNDGLQDVICATGNNLVQQSSDEIYLTQTAGTLSKVFGHALEKPYTSSKYVTKLTASDGIKLLFVASTGEKRPDGQPNYHRLFKLTSTSSPYFTEVTGPYNSYFPITAHPVVADITGDGIDDLILPNKGGRATIYKQGAGATFTKVDLSTAFATTEGWDSIRVVDVLSEYPGSKELVATWSDGDDYFISIFKAQAAAPYFDFRRPVYTQRLDSTGVDLEVSDLDGDGYKDIYVVQKGEKCGNDYYGGIPLDRGRDILLYGSVESGKTKFLKVKMDHKGKGCGGLVRTIAGTERELLLTEGHGSYIGHNYHLKF